MNKDESLTMEDKEDAEGNLSKERRLVNKDEENISEE